MCYAVRGDVSSMGALCLEVMPPAPFSLSLKKLVSQTSGADEPHSPSVDHCGDGRMAVLLQAGAVAGFRVGVKML